ncbi:MAG: metalloregulator ArsR/SmtB family transcription factor [Porticoccaceae bacterium]|nr:metalloregulator ArsR/SmtB family transcription factor [Pseudomonadales bacterium]MCP5171479.1 metalloregulator ArsR/SmtB family transcription factor [Pseudomonadales bacterium]
MNITPLQFYKCLADETRLQSILLIQQEGELCVCELTTALDESQPKISRHLAQLRECELLKDRREGQWVFYQINPELPPWAKDVLVQTCAQNKDYLKSADQRLKQMGNRPQRKEQCC